MAQKGDGEEDSVSAPSGLSTWWGSFYDTAKQKLSETNEFIVRDMKEFTQTVKNDTSKLVADTATSMKDQLNIQVNMDEASSATKAVTSSISGFLGKVVQHVTPIPPEDDENRDATMFLGTSSGVKVMSPSEARLFTLQTSPATYCNEPDNLVEFNHWLESFNLDEKKEELSLLMLDFKEVRSLYTKLVPEAVSHVDFWTRYFYKKSELEKAEQRRARLMERAQEDTELVWDDEDDYDVTDQTLPAPTGKNTSSKTSLTSDDVENTPCSSDLVDDVTKNAPKTDEPKPRDPITCSESDNEASRTNDSPPEVEVVEENANNSQELAGGIERKDTLSPSQSPTNKAASVTSDPPAPEVTTVVCNPAATEDTSVPASSTAKENISSESSLPAKESNPPNKEPSSGTSSDSWEKEFDLDMTEDEINEALQETDASPEEIDGWEEWE